MNADILSCKKEAIALTNCDSPPVDQNGKKKGYIAIMEELWNTKGYGSLGFSRQNLRDQAARMEKLQQVMNEEVIETQESRIDVNVDHLNAFDNLNLSNNEEEHYANSSLAADLHISSSSQFPSDSRQTASFSEENNSVPGCLPDFKDVQKPREIIWSVSPEGFPIKIQSSTITNAYNEIVTWKKNAFLVPYGRVGRDFIDELTSLINDWNNQTDSHHVSLKAMFVFLALALQKPSRKSKSKDHQVILSKRIEKWKKGEIESLVREGRVIQRRIGEYKGTGPPNRSKVFAKLIMEGQINSALRFLNESTSGGVLSLTDDVMEQLRKKHPDPQSAKLGNVLFGPIEEEIPESVFMQIDGEMIREAALKTKGAGGPCGIDANGFRRLIACKSFKQSSIKLCDALALLTRTLCTQYVDPSTLEPLMASRLIPLDKGEGAVRPIGVGEVLRRIIAKCVMNIARGDVAQASGALQLCAGQKSGNEAAVHAMHTIFESMETDGILLIDATNAFNSLNRAAALHNIRVLCPIISVFAINTYRIPTRMFIVGGKEVLSVEGTTQGDPLSMGVYALSIQPLITALQTTSNTRQCWYADDASGVGSLDEIKKWWDTLIAIGPEFGYFPNAKKCWIIVKPEKEEYAKEVLKTTAINITSEGHKHLGAVIGSKEYRKGYINEKVSEWVGELLKLADFAATEPQACYSAYMFGLKHRWTYFMRTIPDTQDLLEALESTINHIVIPAITGHKCNQLERNVLSLPVRFGGLGFEDPQLQAPREYKASVEITTPLVEQIVSQQHHLPEESKVKSSKQTSMNNREDNIKERAKGIYANASNNIQRSMDLASEKGSSTWLTVLPIKENGFNLSKRDFRDAIKLRYNWPIEDIPSKCACGDMFTIDHAMVCRKGGFIIQRHNEVRDLEAELLEIVCKDVQLEPPLQEVTGEQLNSGANLATEARLDIHARGFWEPSRSAFFDIRVCHPNAESYRDLQPQQIYRMHETEKKRSYSRRVLEIEHGSFTPLVFTSTGGMGQECTIYHKRLAELISTKKGERYSSTMAWIRARVSFALLRSSLICLRGSRTWRRRKMDNDNADFDILNSEAAIR